MSDMHDLKPASVPVPKTDDNDPRLGKWLQKKSSRSGDLRAVLIGFPSDEGVRRNGGRPGSAKGPDGIRRKLWQMSPDAREWSPFIHLLEHTEDVGNVSLTGDLEDDQQKLGKIAAFYLERDVIPIILGGGHETAFGHFLGYARAGLQTAIFNMDAHADVRPLKNGRAHSGSPFRQMLEHESACAGTYLAAGLQPNAVAQSHLAFIDRHGGRYMFRDETSLASVSGLFHRHDGARLMVTFDMDAVDQSQAPGVSAPCGNGLPAGLWLSAARLAGSNAQVTSFDLSEVNPAYDRDGQTVTLAAMTIWHFMLGLSQR